MQSLPRDIKIFEHLNFPDQRGSLSCIYEFDERLEIDGFSSKISNSSRNVARGIHWQNQKSPQTKAITVLKGSILDFLIDLDSNSNNFGKLYTFELDSISNKTIFIPAHYGHGFLAKEETTFFYFCFGKYSEKDELTVNMQDLINERTSISTEDWIISPKDKKSKTFKELFKN